MLKTYAVLTSLCVVLTAQHASALQITNRDTTNHTLVVAELKGGAQQELDASPSQVIEDICLKGCTITMPDGEKYEFEGTELVSIEDGLIFLDEPYDALDPSGITDESAEEASAAN